jgi:hypothetical protein
MSGVASSDGFLKDIVSQILPHIYAQALNWLTVCSTVFNRTGSSFIEYCSGSHVASETRINVGPLIVTFVLAYGIFSLIVPAVIHLFPVSPLPPFIVYMTFISCFNYILGYLN